MNDIVLKGIIKDISPSHFSNGAQYNQAHLIVKNCTGEESVIDIVFKKYTNRYKEGDFIQILGNLRTYSQKMEDGRNKIHVYVFTSFNTLSQEELEGTPVENQNNYFQLSGHICKLGELRKFKNGKHSIQLIIANNLEGTKHKINSYIPCIAWGKSAKILSKCNVGDKVLAIGEFHSREYTKNLSEGQQEIRVAHEALIKSVYVNEEAEELEEEG